MVKVFLQIWGGLFYLLNKIFFSRFERSRKKETKRLWEIWSWGVYLIGLPAWVTLFVTKSNWIAAAVETGGGAAMALGLVNGLRGIEKSPRWLDYIARIAAVLGLAYSIYLFGGITKLTQVLELGMTSGFLLGTYLRARQKAIGYLPLLVMVSSNACLMYVEHFPWLVLQQLISFGFLADAFLMQRRRAREA